MINTDYPQFAAGEIVLTRFGQLRTVAAQRGCQVWMVEECDGWHHPANLRRV